MFLLIDFFHFHSLFNHLKPSVKQHYAVSYFLAPKYASNLFLFDGEIDLLILSHYPIGNDPEVWLQTAVKQPELPFHLSVATVL